MTTDFDDCYTISEINKRYKEIYAANQCAENPAAYWALSELFRKAHERLTYSGPRIVATLNTDRVHPRLLRNWAAQQGIPLARMGRVPTNVENAYRREHDLPLIEVESHERPVVDATNAEVRAWAIDNDIEVAGRGRIHRDVLVAYVAAH